MRLHHSLKGKGISKAEIAINGRRPCIRYGEPQQQLAELFETSRINVVEHIQHIAEEGELDAAATCREFRQVRTEGTREVARNMAL